ncbi:glutamyl-tRNA reductase [Corynebacterium frankenforstense]
MGVEEPSETRTGRASAVEQAAQESGELNVSVLVVGMSHRSAPVSLLERLSMDTETKHSAAEELLDGPSVSEAMIVSTCNRFEVYAVTSGFHKGVQDIFNMLHDVSGVDLETLRSYLYVRYGDAAAEHVMTVTAGLDSMVTGEQQIIGQVRAAYQDAAEAGSVGPRLHSLAQASLHAGKRVHSETAIDDAGASMVTYALDHALDILPAIDDVPVGAADADGAVAGGDAAGAGADPAGAERPLVGRRALVLGAGAMASLAATHLGRLGVDSLVIANRTRMRAERLAEHSRQAGVAAEVVDFADRAAALPGVDLVVSATGAGTFTVTRDDVDAAGRELVLVDLSMPRDIDPGVADCRNAGLINIEGLRAARDTEDEKSDARREAEAIIAEELRSFSSEQRVRDVVPAVAALRRHANELAEAELKRLRNRAPELTDDEFSAASRAVHRVVDKLLHQPTVRVKQLAVESGTVSYDTALQELFGLDYAGDADRSVAVPAAHLPAGDFRSRPDEEGRHAERKETA